MAVNAVDKICCRARDLLFIGLVLTCVGLGVGAIVSGFEKREAALTYGGARKVDAARIRKQILDGSLSPRKALYFKRTPR